MQLADWISLALTTLGIAAALVAEHYTMKTWIVPIQYRYALGLVTDMGGLLAWAAWRRITVDWTTALIILAAACLAGGVDAAILFAEQTAARRRWTDLQTANAEMAAQLRTLMSKSTNSRYMRRLREMIETTAFATAALRQERELIALAETQAQNILDQIKEIIGDIEDIGDK